MYNKLSLKKRRYIWSLIMKKCFRSYAYWGLCGLLSIGILKASGVSSNLYSFSHSLDIHGNDEAIKKEAEQRMRDAARKSADAKYWKEYYECQEREKKEKEEKETKRIEEINRRKEEERQALYEYRNA